MAFYVSSSLNIKMAPSAAEGTARCGSPSPDSLPSPAIGARPDMTRCLSVASSMSHGSATTEASNPRESLGSDFSAFSRHSSGSYPSRPSDINTTGLSYRPRDSTGSFDIPLTARSTASRRRGYMRPQGTDFAASARARESVLSLGSIAHLQYYFARTGLLDGKGGRLRKRENRETLDLSALDPNTFLTPKASHSDQDSSYASMGSSPDLVAHSSFLGLGAGSMIESPIDEQPLSPQDEDYFTDEFDDEDEHMLPPTTSTYIHREKPLPKPPSVAELRAELTSSLETATKSLREAKEAKVPAITSPTIAISSPDGEAPADSRSRSASTRSNFGWYEIQGMHILDVMTLAIRAAKIYYTSHDRPDRLDAIKSEKAVRGGLLTIMEVLKRMATRGFNGGMREDEFRTMNAWIDGVHAMLASEKELEAAEIAEQAKWAWLRDEGWEGREYEREEAFLRSMLKGSPDPVENMLPLQTWIPIDRSKPLTEQSLPTPFLAALSNGQRLVQLHNCAVRKSRRRFGAIPTFHSDTGKPYRGADNLRYWLKAAELRWEVILKADALGLQYNTGPEVWVEFEDAIMQWCRKVREEIASELQG